MLKLGTLLENMFSPQKARLSDEASFDEIVKKSAAKISAVSTPLLEWG
ncbi:hypothetical protein [Angelakisella massiliensis]|nr:hypothetical protein [Angelakisella massiliensis]